MGALRKALGVLSGGGRETAQSHTQARRQAEDERMHLERLVARLEGAAGMWGQEQEANCTRGRCWGEGPQ